jgi:hypothetical protein
MAPKRPNYSQERSDRNRSKERKKQARLQRRAEDSEKRKAERSGAAGNRALPPGGNR